MSWDIYLAAPLFTEQQRDENDALCQITESLGLKLFSPAIESARIWQGRSPAQCSAAERLSVVELNKLGMRSSSGLLAWLGGWPATRLPDTGVVWELGWAHAMGIPCVGYHLDLDSADGAPGVNLMLGETLYGHARGEEELTRFLKDFAWRVEGLHAQDGRLDYRTAFALSSTVLNQATTKEEGITG
jgi:nucleoside 2-deoxyribosyltransferase